MTSGNNCKEKVRQEGKESGKILSKNPGNEEKQPGKTSPTDCYKYHSTSMIEDSELQVSVRVVQPAKLITTITEDQNITKKCTEKHNSWRIAQALFQMKLDPGGGL